MNENKTTLWNKNVNDLTVGDAVKINMIVVAAMAAPFVLLAGYGAISEKVVAFRLRRSVKNVSEQVDES